MNCENFCQLAFSSACREVHCFNLSSRGGAASGIPVRPPASIFYMLIHRITECFGLEGTFRGHLAQPPCSEQGHLPLDQVALSPSYLALNVSGDVASTTSLGSLFQCFTTLIVKEFFLISSLNLPSRSCHWSFPPQGSIRLPCLNRFLLTTATEIAIAEVKLTRNLLIPLCFGLARAGSHKWPACLSGTRLRFKV